MLNSWDKINLAQYIELSEVSTDDSFENDDDKLFSILSILLDKSLEEIENMDFLEFNKKIKNFDFIYKPITSEYQNEIKIDDFEFELIPFNNLEFGAFIDIEHLLIEGDSYITNLPKIFSILYRQVIKPSTAVNNAVYEDYSNWLDIRYVLFEKVPITAVYGVINEYMKFRSRIFISYQGLFQEKDDFEDSEEEQEMLRNMTSKEREEYQREKSISKWSWMLLLMRLANNEPINMLKAANMKILEAMNILAMQHELKVG